jgi:ubiquinone/menaquinone biosynthesis C-methylase UbiE
LILSDCRPGPADLLLVVDSSDSVQFNKSIDFITGLIKQIPIGPNDFQVAMITFSWNATVEFTFDHYADNGTLLGVINNVVKEGGPSYSTPALKLAEQVRFPFLYTYLNDTVLLIFGLERIRYRISL